MHKTSKKPLHLSTVTIRRLVDDQLTSAAGGGSVNLYSLNWGSCLVTCNTAKCAPTTSH